MAGRDELQNFAYYWIDTKTPLDFSGSEHFDDFTFDSDSYAIQVEFSFPVPVSFTAPNEITLQLTEGIKNDDEIRVVYNDSSGDGIQDLERNPTIDFDTTAINNISIIPGKAPAFVGTEVNSAGQIVLFYNEDLGTTTASTNDFLVTVDSYYRDPDSQPQTVDVINL